ncbi:YtxH domain-containing protein [Pedobacter sp. GR22-6]|uniref:YtxH domain-containing protein n=1 Tax=Pedobacter sp. GR22-6 TaxID=3127957 RepID=UPI00307F59B2
MNYKKLLTKQLPDLQGSSSSGRTAAVVGLLTGLAVGAVLGILFAPDSGKNTRERISDKALDLADDAKDGLYAIKDKINNGKDHISGLKDKLLNQVKSRVDQASQEFKEFRDAELERTNGTDHLHS